MLNVVVSLDTVEALENSLPPSTALAGDRHSEDTKTQIRKLQPVLPFVRGLVRPSELFGEQ